MIPMWLLTTVPFILLSEKTNKQTKTNKKQKQKQTENKQKQNKTKEQNKTKILHKSGQLKFRIIEQCVFSILYLPNFSDFFDWLDIYQIFETWCSYFVYIYVIAD